MSRSLIEHRIREAHRRLQRAREELAVLDEQLAFFAAEADEARTRALVSDSPAAAREHREAQKHADAMARSRAATAAAITELEGTIDELLERFVVDAAPAAVPATPTATGDDARRPR